MDMMKCIAVRVAAEVDPHERKVVFCDECQTYNRGECCVTGLPMHPEDFCSRAVKAE